MSGKKGVKLEILDMTDSKQLESRCPRCNGSSVVRSNSYSRDVQELGSPFVKKLIRIESITFKCNECGETFHSENEMVPNGQRYTQNVIDLAVGMAIEKDFSGKKMSELLADFFNVTVHRKTINEWVQRHGDQYSERKGLKEGQETNFKDFSGFMALDGCFNHVQEQESSSTNGKKRRKKARKQENEREPFWLHLTRSGDGTLCAMWEE